MRIICHDLCKWGATPQALLVSPCWSPLPPPLPRHSDHIPILVLPSLPRVLKGQSDNGKWNGTGLMLLFCSLYLYLCFCLHGLITHLTLALNCWLKNLIVSCVLCCGPALLASPCRPLPLPASTELSSPKALRSDFRNCCRVLRTWEKPRIPNLATHN